MREGVRTILHKARPDWEICGEAENGTQAMEFAARLKPDIVVLDVTMPGLSGLDAAARMSTLGTPGRILIFTMHASEELGNDVRRVGARGYVTKSDAVRHLVTAIETILFGGTFFGRPEKPQSDPEDNPKTGVTFRLALAFC